MKGLSLLAAAAGVVVLSSLPAAARADQLEWLSMDQAATAQARIAEVGVIRHFCEPCRDNASRAERVEDVEITPIPSSDGQWNVRVNGQPVDLAYVFVPKDGEWRNLALDMGLDASSVAATLRPRELHPQGTAAATGPSKRR